MVYSANLRMRKLLKTLVVKERALNYHFRTCNYHRIVQFSGSVEMESGEMYSNKELYQIIVQFIPVQMISC